MVRGMLYYKTDHAMILSKRKLVRPLKVQDDDYSLLPAPRQLGYMVSGCPSVLPSRQRITASSEVAQNRDTGWAGGSNRTFPPFPSDHPRFGYSAATRGQHRLRKIEPPHCSKHPGQSLGHRADSSASSHSQLKEETSSVKNASNRVC